MAKSMSNRYLRSCEKRNVDPIPAVLEACKAGSSTLSLAGNCISVEKCSVLAKTLQHGHPFTDLDFSDCLMGNEGLSKLVDFLKDDCQITSLVLKGNSIKSNGVITVANLLKRNATIERLSLEWNGIGLQEGDVRALCEGLNMNTSLRVLDLRSNHINHTGTSHIAGTLLLNATIQELDLRWNNLGVLGGRKLLAALKSNGSLVALRLEGNSIPSDIAEAIGTNLTLRLSQHVSEAQHHMETLQLSTQLSQMHSNSEQKMMEVLETLDSERTAFLETTRLSQCELADLKCHLEERDATIARLETKLLEVQGALRESLAKSSELCSSLDQVRSQASLEKTTSCSRIEELEQELVVLEEKRKKDKSEASAKDQTADTKVHSLELELQIQKEKFSATAKDSEFMRENLSSRITALEAQLSSREKQLKDQSSHLQQSHQKELLLREEEHKSKAAVLTRSVQESEEHVRHLEKELKSVRILSGEDRGKAVEETERLQQALKLQTMKNSHLEDQMQQLKSGQKSTVESLRTSISQCQLERESSEQECAKLQQKLKLLQQEVGQERSDWERDRESQRRLLKEHAEERDALAGEIRLLKKSFEEERKQRDEVEGKRESEVKVLQDERNSLRQKLEQQRAVIQRFQADEQQRTFQLKAALNNYFTATPKLTDSDVM